MLHKPVHYESQVPFDWAQMLRDNYHVILEELASDDFPLVPIEQLDEGNAYLNEDNQWKALYLIINGYPTKISKKFPRVSENISDRPCHAMPCHLLRHHHHHHHHHVHWHPPP
jgi:hypothetical protein